MVGERVGPYVIKEALGSGRTGLLYLAVHVETGQRAIIQRLPDKGVSDAFAADAALAMALKASPAVEERKTRSGQAVLFAEIDGAAPGSGQTKHLETQQLPPPSARRRRHSRPWLLAGVLGLLLLAGGAFGAWVVSRVEPPAQPVVAAPLAEPPPAPLPVVAELAPPPEEVAKPEAAPATAPLGERRGCKPDSEWKRRVHLDLQELSNEPVVVRDDALYARVDTELRRLGRAADRATSATDCRAVETGVAKLAGVVRRARERPGAEPE